MFIRFSSEHISAFEQLSRDRNPMHLDAVYSRTTQFGRPIVYGICTVVLALGKWARGRNFQLTQIQGKFSKPLFEAEEYELKIEESGNQVKIKYFKGSSAQSEFSFDWMDFSPAQEEFSPAQFTPLNTARAEEREASIARWQKMDFPYALQSNDLSIQLAHLCLQPQQMPLTQLNALLGSSYLVGMEIPGRQALYSSFDFAFEISPAKAESTEFRFEQVTATLDARFNGIEIAGKGTGIVSFSLQAFQRPEPVRYSFEKIINAVGSSTTLHNQVVFISGATRGFGAVLAKVFAAQGATVLANYRSGAEEAKKLADEAQSGPGRIVPILGDVANEQNCRQMRAEIERDFARLDSLICNAFPAIPAVGFREQNSEDFLHYIQKSFAPVVTLIHEFLPLIPKKGAVVLISTVFTQTPKAQFSHYITAKTGLEGLMHTLALEHKQQRFIVARAPRILTDQTNLAFDFSPPASPIVAAGKLLGALTQPPTPGQLTECNLI